MGDSGLTRLTTTQTWGKPPPSPIQYYLRLSTALHPNGILSRDSQGGVLKLSCFGLLPLCGVITFCSDVGLGWGLKQTCNSRPKLFNGVSHSTCTHRGRVDSRLLAVESQIGNLIPDLFSHHNLCYRCPNGSCEPILDIYVLIAFQWYKECHNARSFDPCNWTMKFQESRWTPKFPFRECESHPHTLLKVGLWHIHDKIVTHVALKMEFIALW
jgi:hypothetical protein